MAEIKPRQPVFPLKVFFIDRKGKVKLEAEFDNEEDLGLFLEFFDSDTDKTYFVIDGCGRKVRVKVESLEVKLLEVSEEEISVVIQEALQKHEEKMKEWEEKKRRFWKKFLGWLRLR